MQNSSELGENENTYANVENTVISNCFLIKKHDSGNYMRRPDGVKLQYRKH